MQLKEILNQGGVKADYIFGKIMAFLASLKKSR